MSPIPKDAIVYKVPFDPIATRRFQVAWQKANWHGWFNAASNHGLLALASAGFAFYMGATHVGTVSFVSAMMLALVAAYLWGVFGTIALSLRYMARAANADADEVWTCWMTDEYWAFRRQTGETMEIPWKSMELKFEHTDAWLVGFVGGSIWVYRKPLRVAGLDEVFFGRIGGNSGFGYALDEPSP